MKIFVIAGEVSGDMLGGAVMAGLKSLRDDIEFAGIGGPKMTHQGLQSLFPMDELSVMGVAEILPKYFHLKRRIKETAEAVLAFEPDILLTIDAPDFCLRVSRLVRQKKTIRTVHYVAPSVWAWRPGRAKKMAKSVDHVLALLPFEPPLMEAAGMECDFVGHPIAGKLPTPAVKGAEFAADGRPVVMVLPGSRRGEVERLGPIFGAAIAQFAQNHPDVRFVLPAAAPVEAQVRQMVATWPVQPEILGAAEPEAKEGTFAAAALALAASGTVSLELAAQGVPMVIGYRMSPMTERLMALLLKTDTVTLVNLVTETRVVPECLGPDCTPEALARAMEEVYAHPETQKEALNLTMERLGRGGEAPGLRAARAILARA